MFIDWKQRVVSGAESVSLIACGVCMEVCPTENITKDPLGRPQWDRRCLACLSCEMKCPEEAITSAVRSPVSEQRAITGGAS